LVDNCYYFVQGPTYYNLYRTLPSSAFLLGLILLNSFFFSDYLVTGTIFAMWLGEKITDKGIGNGISLLIMVGILRFLKHLYKSLLQELHNNGGPMLLVIEIIIWF
jgi:preprotein translocase subunit SecY